MDISYQEGGGKFNYRVCAVMVHEGKLLAMANTWEVRHSGFSGRTAQQFIHYLEGLPQEERQ